MLNSLHLFILCPQILPIWQQIPDIVNQKDKKDINFSNFEKMFGFHTDTYITYIFLSLKYYNIICL